MTKLAVFLEIKSNIGERDFGDVLPKVSVNTIRFELEPLLPKLSVDITSDIVIAEQAIHLNAHLSSDVNETQSITTQISEYVFAVDYRHQGHFLKLAYQSEQNTHIEPVKLLDNFVPVPSKNFLNKINFTVPSAQFIIADQVLTDAQPASASGHNNERQWLASMRFETKMDFAALPLVGELLADILNLSYVDICYASHALPGEQLALWPAHDSESHTTGHKDIAKGLTLLTDFAVTPPFEKQPLDIDLSFPVATERELAETSQSPGPDDDNAIIWKKINKHLGPVHLQRVGGQFHENNLTLAVDAKLALGPVSFTLSGLAITYSLDEKSLSVKLDGLGLSIKNGPFQLSGFLLRKDIPGGTEYRGAIVIKTKTLSISAIGVYNDTDAGKNLFIYANLDYIIGGPPVFFITGLAAAIGVNQQLRIPDIDEVKNFPLLAHQEIGKKTTQDPITVLNQLTHESWLTAKQNALFFAFGVKFSSFNLVESEVLLVASFDPGFRLAALGTSVLNLPKPPPGKSTGFKKYVHLVLDIRAEIAPDEGYVKIDGLIRHSSYLIDPACKVTGGFAFYLWFAKSFKGEFVLTVGGYHPRFKPPAHYPNAPRVGFYWPVSKNITIQGESYFALTASCVMAGGRLSAVYQSGNLRAWFIAKADFLIQWQPFYFDIEVAINLGASYTFKVLGLKKTVSAQFNAELSLYGPPTAGRVKIKWIFISFTIKFGPKGKPNKQRLLIHQFMALLPAKKDLEAQAAEKQKTLQEQADYLQLNQISIISGLVEKPENIARVRADELKLSCHCYIPATEIVFNGDVLDVEGKVNKVLNIRPMQILNVVSKVELDIYRSNDGNWLLDKSAWTPRPIINAVPDALWGDFDNEKGLNRASTIKDSLQGLIIPAPDAQCHYTVTVTLKAFRADEEYVFLSNPLSEQVPAETKLIIYDSENKARQADTDKSKNQVILRMNEDAQRKQRESLFAVIKASNLLADYQQSDTIIAQHQHTSKISQKAVPASDWQALVDSASYFLQLPMIKIL
jgi:hypothetical protein